MFTERTLTGGRFQTEAQSGSGNWRHDSGVYVIVCDVNGWAYVGQTIHRFADRWHQHIYELERGCHCCHLLQRDWNLYGGGQFSFQVLEVGLDTETNLERESVWLTDMRKHGPCYNRDKTRPSTLYEIFAAEELPESKRQEPKGPDPWVNILTVQEVAELKQVANSTVVTAIQAGRLRAWEKGRQFFVRRSDAEAWQPVKGRGRRKAE